MNHNSMSILAVQQYMTVRQFRYNAGLRLYMIFMLKLLILLVAFIGMAYWLKLVEFLSSPLLAMAKL